MALSPKEIANLKSGAGTDDLSFATGGNLGSSNPAFFKARKNQYAFLRDDLNTAYAALKSGANEVKKVINNYNLDLPKDSSWHKHIQLLNVLDMLIQDPRFDNSTLELLARVHSDITEMQKDMPDSLERANNNFTQASEALGSAVKLVGQVVEKETTHSEESLLNKEQDQSAGPAAAA